MDLIETIKEMNKEMSEKFYYINQGGCGKSAFTIYKLLLKIKGVSNVGIVITWDVGNHYCDDRKIRKLKLTDDNILSLINYKNWDHIMVRFKYKDKIYYVDPLKIVIAKDLDFKGIKVHYRSISATGIVKIIRKGKIDWNWKWTSCKKDNEARLVMKKHLRPHFKKGK